LLNGLTCAKIAATRKKKNSNHINKKQQAARAKTIKKQLACTKKAPAQVASKVHEKIKTEGTMVIFPQT
jgi:cytochrome c-type biogenesis protein CcmH/NrfF